MSMLRLLCLFVLMASYLNAFQGGWEDPAPDPALMDDTPDDASTTYKGTLNGTELEVVISINENDSSVRDINVTANGKFSSCGGLKMHPGITHMLDGRIKPCINENPIPWAPEVYCILLYLPDSPDSDSGGWKLRFPLLQPPEKFSLEVQN